MRALTVSLNPAVDKTHFVDGFEVDGIFTARTTKAVAGGKANNGARVLRALGHSVTATGFLGGASGEWIAAQLAAVGIDHRFVRIPADTRTCVTIVDPVTGSTTELREQGPTIKPSPQRELLELLPELAADCLVAIVAGSLPPGVPDSYMSQVVTALSRAGCPVLLDTSGEALEEGLRAGPLLIKPNLTELAALVGCPLSASEAPGAADDVARRHQVDVVVSLGVGGVYAARPDGTGFAVPAPKVEVVNAVGAGDALVAGIASGLMQRLDFEAAVRLGVACGTASVLNEGVAVVELQDVQRLVGEPA